MTVEISNRHWVHFKHPDSNDEFRARFTKTEYDVDVVFEVQKRQRDPDTEWEAVGAW